MTDSIVPRMRRAVQASTFLRFLISGGANTAATYAVYLAMLLVVGYKTAYTIAYVFGILLAFVVNRLFVFQTHRGWQSAALFPLVYLAQYVVSLAVLWAWVEKLRLPEELAPLVAIIITIPLTYVLSRWVFGHHTKA